MTHPQRTSIFSGGAVGVFEAHYAGRPGAGWETGRPQPAFVEFCAAGEFQGRLLDVGCGTGENALMTAASGIDSTGIDAAPTAIVIARRKAAERGVPVRFLEWNALRLSELDTRFDTMIDCGLYHCFDAVERPALAASLASAVVPGGRYFLMCFSDRQPGEIGPRRVTEHDIRETFRADWRLDTLERTRMDVAFDSEGAHAWLAVLTRR
jgi:cyclopropane fatty-acyl-phospholipid synthase-like methyltransferase